MDWNIQMLDDDGNNSDEFMLLWKRGPNSYIPLLTHCLAYWKLGGSCIKHKEVRSQDVEKKLVEKLIILVM